MSRPAIIVENLSKKFRIGTSGGPGYHRLSEMLTGLPRYAYNQFFPRRSFEPTALAAGPTENSLTNGSPSSESSTSLSPDACNLIPSPDFWALKDVSFEVQPGEVVGIIGRNGAGKSTLLKILSRITEPTSGRFGVRGRVASLLEVGTGFHPELTGRENIYVSGVTLGMTRAEIKKRFDEIVDFSGVEKFLDTPVKHYSSGMQVRLGFAVAAHLESEILIVDEVLAVGDGDFQKKCLGRMRSLRTQGRTVLIVSHQMQVVSSLCSRVLVLTSGALQYDGAAIEGVNHYRGSASAGQSHVFDSRLMNKRIGDHVAELHRAWLSNSAGEQSGVFDLSESITIEMDYSIHQDVDKVAFPNFHVFDESGEYVFCTAASSTQLGPFRQRRGHYHASCVIPPHLLNAGTFTVGVALTSLNPGLSVSFFERDALQFQVTEDFDATLDNQRHGYASRVPGPIRPDLDWRIDRCETVSSE